MLSILSGLASLHAAGLAHGDLRPANVLYHRLGLEQRGVAALPDILLTDVGPLPAKCDASRTDYYHAAFTWLQFTCRVDERRPPPPSRGARESGGDGGPRAQLDLFERAIVAWCPALASVVYGGNGTAIPTMVDTMAGGNGTGWNEIERRGAELAWGMLLVDWPAVFTIFEGKAGCVHGKGGGLTGPAEFASETQRAIAKWSELCGAPARGYGE